MTPGYNRSESSKTTKQQNATYIWPFASCGSFQSVNGFPGCSKDTQYFKPEQELLLQEFLQDGCDVGGYRANEVLVPRPAGIFQRFANVLPNLLLQIRDLPVDGPIRELAHVPFQFSVHRPQAPSKEFYVLVGGANSEPLIDASDWINDEVGK